ncbi:HAD family hydrolase [Candidatus Gottesmanbacteria bacterium]|nr:HAD family hydrolase [Candidatus Gottesmanbacteria bacterium]
MAKKKLKIIFDWDGTLIDIEKKYCKVYKDIINTLGGKPILHKVIWALKRKNASVELILSKSKLPPNLKSKYAQEIIGRIEKDEYLALDQLMPGVPRVLENLKNKYTLILCTNRRDRQNLFTQLEHFQLRYFFDDIIFQKSKTLGEGKAGQNDCIVVADSQDYIVVVKKLKWISVAVFCGIRSRKYLQSYHPDFIIKDVRSLPDVLSKVQKEV